MGYTVRVMFLDKIRPTKINLRFFNNLLTVVVAILALYIIAAPYVPQFTWWLKHDSPVKTTLAPKESPAVTLPQVQKPVDGDKLFIPRLQMEETVYGGGIGSLSKGVWHVPHTSTPDKGGNTVLVGHRFTYSGQAVFYHLDKIERDDPITLHWQGKAYEYRVTEIKVVPASELSIEDNTEAPQLTIYTCTPLWSVKNRLVIIAKPLEQQQ